MTSYVVKSATSAGVLTLTLSNAPSNAQTFFYQYCSRADFRYAPVYSGSIGTVSGDIALSQFNQDAVYFIRGRCQLSDGTFEAWGAPVGAYFPVLTAQSLTVPAVLVAPALIVPPEPILGWTPSSENAGYPCRAMGRDDPGSQWVGTVSSNTISFIVQTAGGPIDSFALLETNITEAATWVIQGATTLAKLTGNTPDYTYTGGQARPSANVGGRRSYHAFARLPAPQAYPFWRIAINGLVVPGSNFGASFFVCGLALATKNYATGSLSEQALDQGTMARNRDGSADRALGWRMRNVSLDLAAMSEAQQYGYGRLWNKVGLSEPVLVIPNSKAGPYLHDRILYGVMTERRKALNNALTGTESFTISSLT